MRNFLTGFGSMALICSMILSWALISQKFLVNGGYQIEQPQVDYVSLLSSVKKGH